MLNIPPSRYKIIERDRRLVTIDTLTGAEMGAKAVPLPTESSPQSEADTISRVSALGPVLRANRPSAPLTPSASAAPTSDKTGRIALLVMAGIAGVLFLFLTGAWVVVAVAFAVPPIRALAFTAVKTAIGRFLNPET